VMRMDS